MRQLGRGKWSFELETMVVKNGNGEKFYKFLEVVICIILADRINNCSVFSGLRSIELCNRQLVS